MCAVQDVPASSALNLYLKEIVQGTRDPSPDSLSPIKSGQASVKSDADSRRRDSPVC